MHVFGLTTSCSRASNFSVSSYDEAAWHVRAATWRHVAIFWTPESSLGPLLFSTLNSCSSFFMCRLIGFLRSYHRYVTAQRSIAKNQSFDEYSGWHLSNAWLLLFIFFSYQGAYTKWLCWTPWIFSSTLWPSRQFGDPTVSSLLFF
jgi:hypothetical protein